MLLQAYVYYVFEKNIFLLYSFNIISEILLFYLQMTGVQRYNKFDKKT